MRKIKLLHFFFSCFRYYYGNLDVKEDKEFGNFLNELSIDGKPRFRGGIGKVSLLSSFSSVVAYRCHCPYQMLLTKQKWPCTLNLSNPLCG